MASFNSFLPNLLKVEGGFQNHVLDRGNYNSGNELIGTNYGISAKALEAHIGRAPTVQDMKTLSVQTAGDIYRRDYWNKINASQINSQAVANILADHAVNAGPKTAGKMVQRILNAQFNSSLVVDGIVGRKTLAAINAQDPETLFNSIKQERQHYYNSLGNLTFLSGWLKRLNSFLFTSKPKTDTYPRTILPETNKPSNKRKAFIIGGAVVLSVGLILLFSKKAATTENKF